MNTVSVLIAGYIAFALELGFRSTLAASRGSNIAPSFVFALCVVIAMSSPAPLVLWTCLISGLLTDLTWPHEFVSGVGSATIPGPYALGYLVAGQFVLALRSKIFKRNPLSVFFLCAFGYAISQVVLVALYSFRSGYTPEIKWDPTSELLSRFLAALYTGVVGLVLGIFLGPLSSALGLHQPVQRRYARPLY
jgi:rod shape-determining protein MreD